MLGDFTTRWHPYFFIFAFFVCLFVAETLLQSLQNKGKLALGFLVGEADFKSCLELCLLASGRALDCYGAVIAGEGSGSLHVCFVWEPDPLPSGFREVSLSIQQGFLN